MAYHGSKLVKLSSKGDKYYVQVTKPIELQSKSSKQIKRSTGTTDIKEAQRRQHGITEAIYQEFNDALKSDHERAFRSAIREKFAEISRNPIQIPIDLSAPVTLDSIERKQKKSTPTLADTVSAYTTFKTWGRNKTKREVEANIQKFIDVVGNIQLDKITKHHAYDVAQHYHELGQANQTISKRISNVTGLLKWAERKKFIDINPFHNLDLSDYGVKSKSFLPLDRGELVKLFRQDMNPEERLCLSLLALTGMRLDEVALLRWDQVKTNAVGLYLDLTAGAIVKNQGSQRQVPIHRTIELMPIDGDGRIFSWPVDSHDGKAQNAASKALNRIVVKAVGDHPQKKVHSLRGTFKDLLRELDIMKELNDYITGHSSGDDAGRYGKGPSLRKRAEAINLIDVDFLI